MLMNSSHHEETRDSEENNLGLSEEELVNENDFYVRPSSPVLHEDVPPPYVAFIN